MAWKFFCRNVNIIHMKRANVMHPGFRNVQCHNFSLATGLGRAWRVVYLDIYYYCLFLLQHAERPFCVEFKWNTAQPNYQPQQPLYCTCAWSVHRAHCLRDELLGATLTHPSSLFTSSLLVACTLQTGIRSVLEHKLRLLVWTHQVVYKPHERIWQQPGVISLRSKIKTQHRLKIAPHP